MTESDPLFSGSTTAAPEAPPGTCSVCPHPWDAHDALGRRFCSATEASAKPRGCICRP